MKQLLIYGEQDAGKSTTCGRLFNILKAFDATVLYYERFPWADFKAIIEFANSRIAIYSVGDDNQHLQAALDFANNWDCHILVAAVRVRTHYSETLKDFVCGEDYDWFTLQKGGNPEETNRNVNRIALTILNQITKIIEI